MPSNKRIAFWVSEKKLQKLNWQELETISKKFGFEVFKLSLKKSLESQGPFCVLVHKMTDIIASANMGDIRIAAASRIPGVTPSSLFRLLRFVKQNDNSINVTT